MASASLTTLRPRLPSLDRERVAALIERLVSLLDELDGDIEAESGTWPESMNARHFDTLTDENLEDGADAEPDFHDI